MGGGRSRREGRRLNIKEEGGKADGEDRGGRQIQSLSGTRDRHKLAKSQENARGNKGEEVGRGFFDLPLEHLKREEVHREPRHLQLMVEVPEGRGISASSIRL